MSYAWNKAELDDPRGAGQPDAHFYADYDQRHTVNTYVAYRWSGRTSLSARMRYGSNFPIRGYVGSNAAGYVLSDQRNGLRLPAYARLDLRADRTFTYRKSRLTVFLEVVNATNRDNYRPSSAGVNHQHAPDLRTLRDDVSVAAGGGSADRILEATVVRLPAGQLFLQVIAIQAAQSQLGAVPQHHVILAAAGDQQLLDARDVDDA